MSPTAAATTSPQTLSEQDLYDIVNGACLFGSGGGGPISLGQSLVQSIVKAGKPVTLADPKTMPATAQTAVSAGVGSPDAAASGFPLDAAGQAFDALGEITGKKLTYVLPGEVGGANSIVPMTTAMTHGIPLLDAAGAPRAMPQFEQATFAIRGAPIGTVALANASVQVSFAGKDPTTADVTVRSALSSALFTEAAGLAFWAMDGATMQRVSLRGTTTRARKLGAALRKALGQDPVAVVCKFLRGRVLVTGTITAWKEQTAGGFDTGYVIVSPSSGPALQVINQNENMLAWFEDATGPAVMAPDLITCMTVAGQPFSLADKDLAKGKEIVVIAAPCPSPYNAKPVISAWIPLLRSAGYWGPYLPFK